ncbi:hypothetical protein D3C78_1728550 [compost metagenome]
MGSRCLNELLALTQKHILQTVPQLRNPFGVHISCSQNKQQNMLSMEKIIKHMSLLVQRCVALFWRIKSP